MRILLLSCSTGEGHNGAARALANALQARGAEAELFDALTLQSEGTRRRVASAYNNLIRYAPPVFGAVYQIGAFYERTKLPSPVYAANKCYAVTLANYVRTGGYDAVICTHLFPMMAMTAAKRKCGLNTPTYGVITDYTIIPFFSNTDLDGYFVPTETVAEELTKRNIAKNKITVTGIPVDEKFETCDKAAAREALGLQGKEKIVVVLSGGAGCGSYLRSLGKKMISALGTGHHIFLFTGKNQSLYQSLSAAFADASAITVVPFTSDIHLYVQAADVVLTKPGGLSATEVATCGKPLVLVREIPGCETKNRKYFTENGLAVYANTQDKMVVQTARFLSDSTAGDAMCARQKRFLPSHPAADILTYIAERRSAVV